ncbi:MAG TPA: flagellar basal body rod protein FlgC [Nevskia sp.]|nr:flagellar basal body rod protein FlgC [Nevskia sp.]
MSDYSGVMAISASGMQAERLRLEVAAQNLANAHSVSGAQSEPYRALRAVPYSSGAGLFEERLAAGQAASGLRGVDHVDIVPTGGEPRLDHDPGNPLADAQGMVRMPQINVADEMLTVMTSVRAYEADVRAMSAAKSIALKALDIGSNRS